MKHDYQLSLIATDYMGLAQDIVQLSKQTPPNAYELYAQVYMFFHQ